MKILGSWLDKPNDLMGEKNPAILKAIVIGSSALLLIMYYRRNNMKKATSTHTKTDYTVSSLLRSSVTWFWSKDLTLQKLEELYKVRQQYGKLVEEQTRKIEEINRALGEIQKDFLVKIRINEIKLDSLMQKGEDKSINNEQKELVSEEAYQQYEQLQQLLIEYPESKIAPRVDRNRRSVEELQADIKEVSIKIEERISHHQKIEFCYQQLMNHLGKELREKSSERDLRVSSASHSVSPHF